MDIIIILVPLSLFSVFIGHYVGWSEQRGKWEAELIKRGLAQYNPTTGKWEWKS